MYMISTNGIVFQIDIQDYNKVRQYRWSAYRYYENLYYLTSSQSGTTIYLHRLIMDAPKGLCVDHINRDTLDNRRLNLRVIGQRKNLANAGMFSNNSTGYRGVIKYKSGFRAQTKLRLDDKQYIVSSKTYYTKTEPALVRDEVMTRIHGKNIYLNFPGIMPTGQLMDDCDAIEERFKKRGILFSQIRQDKVA